MTAFALQNQDVLAAVIAQAYDGWSFARRHHGAIVARRAALSSIQFSRCANTVLSQLLLGFLNEKSD
jgi:hypothetical protein